MIPNTLILPTERPPLARDVKRALLTYDTVYLCSPDDRELIPPNTYQDIVTGMPPVLSMPVAAVRPLGKVAGYDASFEQLLVECKPAIRQGSVKVLPAPVHDHRMTVGWTPIPEGIPSPSLTYRAYRALAAQSEIIAAVAQGLDTLPSMATMDLDALAPAGADDSKSELWVNGKPTPAPDPPFALYPGFAATPEERVLLTRLCLARLGSLSRNLLACELHDLAPYTSDAGLAAVIQRLEENLPTAFDELLEGADRSLLRRLSWLERVVITEFVDMDALDSLTIDGILKLRTKAWGTGNEARYLLIRSLKGIAIDSASQDDFKPSARRAIKDYLARSSDLRHERSKLILASTCDLGARALKSGGFSLAAGELIQRFLSTGSLETALICGALHAVLSFSRDNGPPFLDYIRKRNEVKGSSGYALFRAYESLPRRR